MPIRALIDITAGAVLVDTAGTHFSIIEAPMRDGDHVVRYYVSPLNRIGGSTPIYHAAACTAGNQYFDAAKAIDGIYFCPNYGQLDIARVYQAGELDASHIPYTVEPGLFELRDGGRLLIEGTEIYLGRNGVVEKITINERGQFKRANGIAFDPGVSVPTKDRILKEARGFESGTVFVANVEGVTRIFKRRDHGIEAVDGGPRVTMGDLEGDLTALTTTEIAPGFAVGQVVQVGASERAKIVFNDGSDFYAVTPSGGVLCMTPKASQLPTSSEFAKNEITLGGYRVHVIPNSTTVFPEPKPLDAIPAVGTIIEYGAPRLKYFVTANNESRIRVRKLRQGHLHLYNGTEQVKDYIWSDGEGNHDLILAPDGVYGLPDFMVVQAALPTISREEMEPGALYLLNGGQMVSDNREASRFLGNERRRVTNINESVDPANPHNLLIEAGPSRYTILRKLAEAGTWFREVQENGHFGSAMIGRPDTTIEVAGVKWPMTAEGERFLRRLLDLSCPRCSSPTHREATGQCWVQRGTVNEIVHVCMRCIDSASRCPGCRTNMDGNFNAYGVCPRCYAAGNFEIIRNHSYTPKLEFHGTGPLFFGTEVELVFLGSGDRASSSKRNQTAKLALEAAKGLWYAKNDGSIGDGIEFVSHPFTLPWLLENKAQVKSIFDALSPHMIDRDCCGLHIHTSKDGYGVLPSSVPNGEKLSAQRLLTRGLMRVQRFIYGNPKLTIHFAGRESEDYASLAVEGRGFDGDSNDSRATAVSEMKMLAERPDESKDCRYAAMNMTEKTVEFRVFKSTVDFDEYLRNVLFLDSVIQYCRTHALPKNGSVGVKAYRRYLESDAEKYAPVLEHLDEFEGVKKAKEKPMPAKDSDFTVPATPMAHVAATERTGPSRSFMENYTVSAVQWPEAEGAQVIHDEVVVTRDVYDAMDRAIQLHRIGRG